MALVKKKRKSNLLVITLVIAIMLTAYNSYAKYISSINTNAKADIAKWSVKLNTEDITQTSTLTNNVAFHIMENQYVAEGKFAPASEGYFDLTIDTSDAEVSAQYEIEIDFDSITDVDGLSLVGYKAISDTSEVSASIPADVSTDFTNNKITGTITLSENHGQAINIRIFVRWDNTNNISGGVTTTSVRIPMEVTVEQYN